MRVNVRVSGEQMQTGVRDFVLPQVGELCEASCADTAPLGPVIVVIVLVRLQVAWSRKGLLTSRTPVRLLLLTPFIIFAIY